VKSRNFLKGAVMMAVLVTYIVCLNPPAGERTWPLEGLNRELNNIAYMESSYGRNINHRSHWRGEFHTAYGALGLKPVTAHWQYIISPRLQKQFPGLKNEAVFLQEFKYNKKLYTQCANEHWRYLRKVTPTLNRAVFSWRWGLTASNEATNETIATDTYTVKYGQVAN